MRDELTRLVLRIVVLAAVVVGAVVATAKADTWWSVAVAVAALIVAAVLVGASLAAILGAQDRQEMATGARRSFALAAIPLVAVALAIALPAEVSAANSDTQHTAGAAAQTVRDFLATAVLDDNTYAACQYLTPAAQERVASIAGNGQTCRDVFTSTQPSFGGLQSEGSLHALALHAVLRDNTAYVTAKPRGRREVTFVLQRTTAEEAAAYQAPPAAWRIAGGALAVLSG
ncbi:MAG TPA: hypothetical protein VKB54_10795 [Solirubrobacteraceae bacterium]|nr:hypothetical protein [Solirubrobacteraceae bacterium]